MSLSAVESLIVRVAGKATASRIQLEWMSGEDERDVFELSDHNGGILIKGNSESALSSGFYWYLKHTCGLHLSWCGSNWDIPDPLPQLREPIRQVSPYQYRYNLNYCTYSYSMPFWDWDRWERELDWMALNGVNLVLSLIGQEEVWRRTLLRIGYTEHEVSNFICGPAFFAWQWMQNMTTWGGPLPAWWYEERTVLANRIHERMLELGMSPILQGYSGMVPRDFGQKHQSSTPIEQGKWCQFDRPSLLLPSDPMYKVVADTFYEEQKKLFGTDIHYYSIDPFHEGGNTEGINLTAYAEEVHRTMLKHDSAAVWVFQAWEGNPKREILEAIDPEHALILDLWCESKPAWKELDSFYGHRWVWCMIQNYGGKNGLFGNLETISREPLAAMSDHSAGRMVGIGMAMEGINTNPVMYDLITDMFWRQEVPELDSWLDGYIARRYGKVSPSAKVAWNLLKTSVYNCEIVQQGARESLICARPGIDIENVSKWGPKSHPYQVEDVRKAAQALFECYDECSNSDGYLYDLVDVTRQALADLSRKLHAEMVAGYLAADLATFDICAERFIGIIDAQERLLCTRPEFRLGGWLEAARRMGRTPEEQDWFEWNARTLITVWGPEASAQDLRDYSHREWSGLIESFYKPRWMMFIESLRKSLVTGEEPTAIDWYVWEEQWTRRTDFFQSAAEGSVSAIVETIFEEYLNSDSFQS